MGLFSNLLKKNEPKKQLRLHLVELKYPTKKMQKLYSGQIVSIVPDEKKDGFSLETYPDNQVVGHLSSSDYEYGRKYDYALLKDISEKGITACIICDSVYLQNFHISTIQNLSNGEILEIKKEDNTYKLISDSKIIGEITDNRITENIINNISYISYDNGYAKAVIFKK